MFDSNFSPYDALQILNTNVTQLDHNLANLIKAHNSLANLVKEQGETIDALTMGLNNANKANQILMSDMISTMTDKLKDMR
jgi:hypothetical protein